MLVSTFLDPNGNGLDITDVATLLGVIGVIGSGVVIVARVARRILREEIRAVVDDRLASYTQQIQPGYRNGGGSLADIGDAVRLILQHVAPGEGQA